MKKIVLMLLIMICSIVTFAQIIAPDRHAAIFFFADEELQELDKDIQVLTTEGDYAFNSPVPDEIREEFWLRAKEAIDKVGKIQEFACGYRIIYEALITEEGEMKDLEFIPVNELANRVFDHQPFLDAIDLEVQWNPMLLNGRSQPCYTKISITFCENDTGQILVSKADMHFYAEDVRDARTIGSEFYRFYDRETTAKFSAKAKSLD